MKFDIANGKIVVNHNLFFVKELREIYEADKSKDKNVAIKFLSYIHVVAQVDPDAPFYTADAKEVERLAKRNIFGDYDFDFSTYGDDFEDAIKIAIENYKKSLESPEERMLKVFDNKIDQIRKMIEDTTPEIIKNENGLNGTISFSTNIAPLIKAMSDIDKLMDTKDKLKAKIRKESIRSDTGRGGVKLSRLERKKG